MTPHMMVICEHVERGDDGRVSLIGICRSLIVDTLPMFMDKLYFYVQADLDKEKPGDDIVARVSITDPKGEEFFGGMARWPVKDSPEHDGIPHAQFVINFHGVEISQEGTYVFRMAPVESPVAEARMSVKLRSQ